MLDKALFNPDLMSIVNFKCLKGQVDANEDFDLLKITGYHVESSLKLAFNLNDKLIKTDFFVEIKSDSKGANTTEAIGSFHLVYIFNILNLEQLAKPNKQDVIELDPLLANALSSITYSTSRGILLGRLQGTALGNFILPVLNPSKLLSR
jgi:hypothetical protein